MSIEKIEIVQPSLYGFLQEYDKYKAEGYNYSDKNEFFPMFNGHLYYCTMFREVAEAKPATRKKAVE